MTTQPSAADPKLRLKVEQVISRVLQELLTSQGTVVSSLDATTPLFGREGCLDSLGLVSLVVSTEQALQDELDLTVSLADEKALSQSRSPYRTIGSLAEYVVAASS
jgi:acyl carrier protein